MILSLFFAAVIQNFSCKYCNMTLFCQHGEIKTIVALFSIIKQITEQLSIHKNCYGKYSIFRSDLENAVPQSLTPLQVAWAVKICPISAYRILTFRPTYPYRLPYVNCIYIAMKAVSLEVLFLSINCFLENRRWVAEQQKYLLHVSEAYFPKSVELIFQRKSCNTGIRPR